MNRILALALVAVLLTGIASAQDEVPKFAFSAGGGVAWPLAPKEFRDAWKLGSLSVGGSVGYSITPAFSVLGSVEYNTFSFDETGFLKMTGLDEEISFLRSIGAPVDVKIQGGDVTILAASVNAKVSIDGDVVSPYFVAGGGYMNLSVDEVTATVTAFGRTESGTTRVSSEGAVFFAGGPGLDFHASDLIDVFLQGSPGLGLTKGQSTLYLPVKGGVSVKI